MAEKRTRRIAEKPIEPIEPIIPKWRLLSGGLTLLDRRHFNKGDVFTAQEHEISDSFRNSVERITPVEKKEIKKEEPKYFIREIVASAEEQDAEGYEQLYEIIDSNDKVISGEPGNKKEISRLIKWMS